MRICNLTGRSYLDPASNSHHLLTGKCVVAGGGNEQFDLCSGPQLSRQNKLYLQQNKINSRQNKINSRQNKENELVRSCYLHLKWYVV